MEARHGLPPDSLMKQISPSTTRVRKIRGLMRAITFIVTFAPAICARGATVLDHGAEHRWLVVQDPTLLSNRLSTEVEYDNFKNGRSSLEYSNTLRLATLLREGLAFGIQAKLPWKVVDTGTDHVDGLGDIQLRAGIVGRLSPTMRYGLGLNATFDTAANPALGDGAFVLRPILAYRWHASKRVNLGLNIEYNFTPSDEGTNDVSALELKIPVNLKINDDWSAFINYKPRWNFLTDREARPHRVRMRLRVK